MSAPMWTQADAPSPMFLQNPAIRQAAKTRNSTGVPKGRRPFQRSGCVTGPEQQTELTRSTIQPEQLGVDPILLYDGAWGFAQQACSLSSRTNDSSRCALPPFKARWLPPFGPRTPN